MFVIKYNTAGGFTKENAHFYKPEDDSEVNIPYYDESEDSGFIKACRNCCLINLYLSSGMKRKCMISSIIFMAGHYHFIQQKMEV